MMPLRPAQSRPEHRDAEHAECALPGHRRRQHYSVQRKHIEQRNMRSWYSSIKLTSTMLPASMARYRGIARPLEAPRYEEKEHAEVEHQGDAQKIRNPEHAILAIDVPAPRAKPPTQACQCTSRCRRQPATSCRRTPSPRYEDATDERYVKQQLEGGGEPGDGKMPSRAFATMASCTMVSSRCAAGLSTDARVPQRVPMTSAANAIPSETRRLLRVSMNCATPKVESILANRASVKAIMIMVGLRARQHHFAVDDATKAGTDVHPTNARKSALIRAGR